MESIHNDIFSIYEWPFKHELEYLLQLSIDIYLLIKILIHK